MSPVAPVIPIFISVLFPCLRRPEMKRLVRVRNVYHDPPFVRVLVEDLSLAP